MVRAVLTSLIIISSGTVATGWYLSPAPGSPGRDAVTEAHFTDFEFATGNLTGFVPPNCVFWADTTTKKDAFKITGGNHVFDGCLHSNYDLIVLGNDNIFNRTVEYVTTFASNYNNHQFLGGIVKVPAIPYPHPFHLKDFAPGGVEAAKAAAKGEYFYYSSSTTLDLTLKPNGLYYVDGTATIDGPKIGNITIVARDKMMVKSNGLSVRPYTKGLLFMANASGSNALQFVGNTNTMCGIMYDIEGDVKYSGNVNTFYGQMIGYTVSVAGSQSKFYARAPALLAAGRGCPI